MRMNVNTTKQKTTPAMAGSTAVSDQPVKYGLYGPRGWTDTETIRTVLAKYTALSPQNRSNRDDNWDIGSGRSFLRFWGLSGEDASRLLDTVPVANLSDRQNDAPTLYALLELARRLPRRVRLSGYLIGSGRADERLTVDAIELSDPALGRNCAWPRASSFLSDQHVESTRASEIFMAIVQAIQLHGWLRPADEIRPLKATATRPSGWWLWWD